MPVEAEQTPVEELSHVPHGGVGAIEQRVERERRVGDDERLAVDVSVRCAVGDPGDRGGASTEGEEGDEDQALQQPPVAAAG